MAGMQVMELWRKNIRPLDIMTEKAFRNALTADMALGCSTNSMLHLPAIAHECGVEINLDIANEISAHTPNLCHLAPAGHTYMEEQGLHLFSRHRGVFRKRFFVGFQHAICVCSILVQVHSSLVFRHRDIRAREDHMALAAHGIFLGNVSSKIADEIVYPQLRNHYMHWCQFFSKPTHPFAKLQKKYFSCVLSADKFVLLQLV